MSVKTVMLAGDMLGPLPVLIFTLHAVQMSQGTYGALLSVCKLMLASTASLLHWKSHSSPLTAHSNQAHLGV